MVASSFVKVSRSRPEFLLERNATLEHACGWIGDLAQIIGLPSMSIFPAFVS